MNILVPAAGNGTRFSSEGYETLKPLVPVQRGDPMIRHVCRVAGLEREGNRVLWGVQRGHEEQFLAFNDNAYSVYPCDRAHLGQSGTVLDLVEFLPAHEPVVVMNSDVAHHFDVTTWAHELSIGVEAALLTITADSTSYSYIDEFPVWTYATEKQVISDQAITGVYFFRDAFALRDALRKQIYRCDTRSQLNGEYYLSGALRNIPGNKIAHNMDEEDVFDVGTPTLLEAYRQWLRDSTRTSDVA